MLTLVCLSNEFCVKNSCVSCNFNLSGNTFYVIDSCSGLSTVNLTSKQIVLHNN